MNTSRSVITVIAAAALLVPCSRAQGPMPGQMPAGMQANMKAWQKWRQSHKNINALERTIGAIEAMDRDPKTRLSKAQAKTTLSVIKAWRKKTKMTDAQARQVNKQLTASFTVSQLKKVTAAPGGQRNPSGGPGGPGGFGGPPPGGPPPGGFGGPRPGGPAPNGAVRQPGGPGAMPSPKDYNPLNPSTLPFPPMRQMMQQRLNSLTRQLAAR